MEGVLQMIKPDVLVAWPRQLDYPLFRYNLKRFRHLFGNVYIILTQNTMKPQLTESIVNSMEDVTFVKSPGSDGKTDWRDVALKEAINNYAHDSHILFLEQDFLIKDASFLSRIFAETDKYDFIYYKEGERIHPAFALVKTELVKTTSMNFAAKEPYDHFGYFFTELPTERSINITDLGFIDGVDFYHMAGHSNNFHCHNEGQPFFKPQEFLTYCHLVKKLPVKQIAPFYNICLDIEKKHGFAAHTVITNFFPK